MNCTAVYRSTRALCACRTFAEFFFGAYCHR